MNQRTVHIPLLVMQVAAAMLVATLALGEGPSKSVSDTDIVTLLQSRMKQVDELRDLDDAAKAKIKDVYQQALGEMEAVKRWTEKGAEI